MNLNDYVLIVQDQLTGFGVLQSELDDDAFKRLVNMALREMQRYYNAVDLLTIPAEKCIDLADNKTISTIVGVYKAAVDGGDNSTTTNMDPVYMSQLQMYNLVGNMRSNDMIRRYSTYSSMQRVTNTMSTDLAFRHDKRAKKLYVNYAQGMPGSITIEYIPILKDVEDVVEEFWQDILIRLSVAHAKIAVGRIRSRFTQSSGSVWIGDGEAILAEGNNELTELRNRLRDNTDLVLPID